MEVMGDLELEEAVESHPGAVGEVGFTQSFAFGTKEDEELPIEASARTAYQGDAGGGRA